MAKAEQRSSSRSKIQPPEPSVPTLEVEYIPVTRRFWMYGRLHASYQETAL
jgi:hypothetical protein